jgi:hypothetical protein
VVQSPALKKTKAELQLFLRACRAGFNAKLLPKNTPDLFELAEAIELHNQAADGDPSVHAAVVANAMVIHRAVRGSAAQKWLFEKLNGRPELQTTGGGERHAADMRALCAYLLFEYRNAVEHEGKRPSFLRHNEGRAKFMSGDGALEAGDTPTGSAGLASAAHMLTPLIHDILVAPQGSPYVFSSDDYMLCAMSFFQNVCLKLLKKKIHRGLIKPWRLVFMPD